MAARSAPKPTREDVAVGGGELADGVDRHLGEPFRRDGPNTPDEPNRERMKELDLCVWFDHHHPVRFGDLTADFGEELRAGNTNRDCEPRRVQHVAADCHADRARWPEQVRRSRDVEKGLVDRDLLDQRREVSTDVKHAITDVEVVAERTVDHDEFRTQLACFPEWHRRPHAERSRLVARGKHHAAADGDRFASQLGTTLLLDRCVERVEVDVQNRRRLHLRHGTIIAPR